LDDGKSVGPVRRISSAFSFYPDEEFFRTNIRTDGTLEPAGCLGDLGWYCLRIALWTMRWRLPCEVTGRRLAQSVNRAGRPATPTEFSGELIYDERISVEFYASFHAAKQQWVHISGQQGWLRLPDFIHPYDSYEPAFEVNQNNIRCASDVKCPPGVDPMLGGHATAQDARMWRNFANQIFSGRLNDDWPRWALQTQQVLDACHEAARRGSPVKI
jgi:predicted dehydrogenase